MPELHHLWAEASPIPSHAIAALIATVLGILQLLSRKGTRRHRILGWCFVAAMAYAAISALFITGIQTWGRFSYIHLLIPVTLYSLFTGVRHARAGRIKQHRNDMILVVVLAGILTAGFTLLPGRTMHKVLFGDQTESTTR